VRGQYGVAPQVTAVARVRSTGGPCEVRAATDTPEGRGFEFPRLAAIAGARAR
jgi:hypothetical protein